jgi:hypothetical protein
MTKQSFEKMYQRLKDDTRRAAAQDKAQSYEIVQAMSRQATDAALHKLAETCFVGAMGRFNTTKSRRAKQRENALKLKKQYLASITNLAALSREESSAYRILNEIVEWLAPGEVGEMQHPGEPHDIAEFAVDEQIKNLLRHKNNDVP